MKRLWKRWVKKLKAKTPIFWIWMRNFSIAVIAAVGVINTTASTAIAPAWYTNYQWYILAVSGFLGFFAQSQTKKEPPTVNDKPKS